MSMKNLIHVYHPRNGSLSFVIQSISILFTAIHPHHALHNSTEISLGNGNILVS